MTAHQARRYISILAEVEQFECYSIRSRLVVEEQDQVLRTSDDRIGIGGLVLSRQSRTPTSAAGGLEITIGDRALNYREEKVIEAYYTCV